MTTLIEFAKQIQKMRDEFVAQGQDKLKEELLEFFVANPTIKQIYWTQYSPYFNDGDECVFNVHPPTFSNDPDASIRWGEIEDSELEGAWVYGDDTYADEGSPEPTDAEKKAMDEFSNLWNYSAIEDIFETLFGNHVQITVTAEGIDVQEYDHD